MDGSALGRIAVAAVVVVFSSTPSAIAAVGVGVGTVPLTVTAHVVAGHSYRLSPDFQVLNTSNGIATYTFRVERLSKQNGSTLTPSWIAFNPLQRKLRPGRAAHIAVTLHLPLGTHSGTYVSDIVATGSETSAGSRSVRIGAAAATPIRFTIGAPPNGLAGVLGWPWPLWADLTAAFTGGLLILLVGWRKLGLRVVVERDRPHDPS